MGGGSWVHESRTGLKRLGSHPLVAGSLCFRKRPTAFHPEQLLHLGLSSSSFLFDA